MGAHAFGVSVLHAVADLDRPAQALRQVGWPPLQVTFQRVQPLFIWGDIFHSDVKPALKIHPRNRRVPGRGGVPVLPKRSLPYGSVF